MKRLTIPFFFILLSQSVFSQHDFSSLNNIDTLGILRSSNFYNDTLWVMDSSHSYGNNYNSFDLLGTYTVSSRDKNGNQLTGLRRHFNLTYQVFENRGLDSIFYFAESSDVQFEKSYTWNNVDEIWMDSEYREFNTEGRNIQSFYKYWSNNSEAYTGGRKYLTTYDDTLVLERIIQNFIPETGSWINEEKRVYARDHLMRDSLITKFVWNIDQEKWVSNSLYQFYFADLSRPEKVYTSVWDDEVGNWVYDKFTSYLYDENGNYDTVHIFKWSSVEENWKNDRLISLTYLESGQVHERITKVYIDSLNHWGNSIKHIFSYGDSNTTQIRLDGDSISDNWEPVSRFFQSRNLADLIDTTSYEIWDEVEGYWVYSHNRIDVYDHRFNVVETSRNRWSESTNSWEKTDQTFYFWNPFQPLGLQEIDYSKIDVYPNPGTNHIQIRFNEQQSNSLFELFDMSGQLVLAETIHGRLAILNTNFLKPGTYIYRISNDNGLFDKGKWVKISSW